MQNITQAIVIRGDERFMSKLRLFIKQSTDSSVSAIQKSIGANTIKTELKADIKAYIFNKIYSLINPLYRHTKSNKFDRLGANFGLRNL